MSMLQTPSDPLQNTNNNDIIINVLCSVYLEIVEQMCARVMNMAFSSDNTFCRFRSLCFRQWTRAPFATTSTAVRQKKLSGEE